MQQKEGYSDYRWEDVAAALLRDDASLKQAFEAAKLSDPTLSTDSRRMLQWLYRHSEYYEPEHMRYPVFRME